MERVQKLKEEYVVNFYLFSLSSQYFIFHHIYFRNKKLEGKIEEQKKTKKFLKDLFLQQTTSKMQNPTEEQWALIREDDSDDEEEIHSEEETSENDSETEESEPETKRKRRK
jgi:hypothetical protein